MITRKLELKEGLSDGKIDEFEKQLIEWGIHLASKFQGEDNHFIVGFENEADLLAFELRYAVYKSKEGEVNDNRRTTKK